MADTKIHDLTLGTMAATDEFPTAISPFTSGNDRKYAISDLDTYLSATIKTLTNKSIAISQLTGTGTGVLTALAANVNGSGAISLTTSPSFITPSVDTITITTATRAAVGSDSIPAYSFTSATNSGFWLDSGNIRIVIGAVRSGRFVSNGMSFESANILDWAADLFLARGGAANLRIGGANAASPVAQTFSTQGSRSGSDTNVGGGNLTVQSGTGTGTGTISTLFLQSPVAIGSGTGAQTQTTGMAIKAGTAVLTSYVVASLPAAATAGAGATAFVTDASTTLILGLGGTVAGSGSNKVPVYSDGTNWIYG